MILHGSKTWLLLQELSDFGPQFRDHLTNFKRDTSAHRAVGRLMAEELVIRNDDGLLEITILGKRTLTKTNDTVGSLERTASARVIGHGSTTGSYSAKELGRTCAREGAYDAYDLPSLIAGQRVYPREIGK
jgi:hypothetical protein